MNSLEHLSAYLRVLERRFQLAALVRGFAVSAAAALAATVLVVLVSNRFAFSERSLTTGRLVVFLAVALAAAFGLVIPLLRANRRSAARSAEKKFPGFEERLLTLAEAPERGGAGPFLELLAADTVQITAEADPRRLVSPCLLAGFASGAVVSAAVLLWLILAGPGFLGYGASALWAGPSRETLLPFYSIVLEPGDHAVRRGASQAVTARVRGFQPESVRLFARFRSASKWEEAPMLPQEAAGVYGYVFAGIPETLDYYAASGAVRSKTHTLTAIDLPVVKRIRVTYRYPAWTGLKESVEDPGGDLRAIEGTEAEVAVETDRPLSNGVLVRDDGTEIELAGLGGNQRRGVLKMDKDGSYYVAVRERGELVRLSEDYFIEAKKDGEPEVRIVRPGRDAKVSPIEEVTVSVSASDDFGLRELNLRYSVNGGPERTIALLSRPGTRSASESAVLPLEDFKLVPGDVVAISAAARDAHATATTDIFFLEAQPFEREYSQSQIMGGGGEGEDGGRISQRQKEIIAATWNQIRNLRDRAAAAENAKFLAEMQTRLRDQARSLAGRMRRRQLAGANQEFQSFADNMEKAAESMDPAAEKLRALSWKEALPHEQKALQHLMRAEAVFRKIQLAYGASQGGGGMGRDLENLFDLELDTEKNQYETGQQAATSEQRSRDLEEALGRLEELARRQQELAEQQRRNPQAFQQRWQQEMLRREAEQLQRRLEQLARGESQSAQSQTGQSGSPQGGAAGSRRRGMEPMGRRGHTDPRLEQALRNLREATEDMRRAGSAGGEQRQGGAESRRAAERLREAQELIRGLRRQEHSQRLDEIARQAEDLAARQRDFANRLAQLYAGLPPAQPGRGMSDPKRKEAQQMAGEKLGMAEALERLERGMKSAVRDLAQSNPKAAGKLRDALGDLQMNELALRMRYNHEMLRRGWGQQTLLREGPVSQGLEALRNRLREAQKALEGGGEGAGERGLESALAEVERLRESLERMARSGRGGRPGGEPQPAPARSGQGEAGGQRAEPAHRGGLGGSQEGGAQQSGGPVFSAMNRGELRPPEGAAEPRPGDAAGLARFHRDALRDLSGMRRSLQDDPEAMGALEALLREMQRLDPSRFPGNPGLLERMYAQALPALQQLEVQLRRRLDEKQQGQVRISAPEKAPPGYAEAVAEYFRRLSGGK